MGDIDFIDIYRVTVLDHDLGAISDLAASLTRRSRLSAINFRVRYQR